MTLTDLSCLAMPGTVTALLDLSQIDDMAIAGRRFLVADERSQFARLRNDKRRLEWLAARICVKLLAKRDGMISGVKDCQVSKRPSGRPYLTTADGEAIASFGDCSLSHKGRFACACLSSKASLRVGVDVEKISVRLSRIQDAFSHPCDTPGIEPSTETDLTVRWTLKEAYSKSVGAGMRLGLQNLICEQDPKSKAIVVRTRSDTHAQARYLVYEGYVIGVCFAPHPALVPSYERTSRATESTGYIR